MTTNAAVMARRHQEIARGVAHATSIAAARAFNSEVWDVEGRRYIDFAGGIAVLAFDLLRERGSDEPDAESTRRAVQRAYENGLVILSCGTNFNTIRTLVPPNASDAIADEGLEILGRCLAA
jgi:4-aminobutyrate aminotransferase-like enzyme